jgi:hypothetical protein
MGEGCDGEIMSEKLFYDIRGIIPMHTVTVDDQGSVASDTPFVAVGMYVNASDTPNKAIILCAVQGGKILSIRASNLRINLGDDMKKALAEVILTS